MQPAIDIMNDGIRANFIKNHNEYRSKRDQLDAANMKKMYYSMELEKAAREYLNAIPPPEVGPDATTTPKWLSDNELDYYSIFTWQNDRKFCIDQADMLRCAKFTNIACSETNRVGCSLVNNTGKMRILVTCFYRPKCTPSHDPYIKGEQCTRCTNDSKNCEEALCAHSRQLCPADCRDLFQFNCGACNSPIPGPLAPMPSHGYTLRGC
ncbi:hypothetical protein HELRODRAFT_178827 [Helobdella robusta]|uniref:SCP domain-containing protein n=1 Tax=Helobdella robusta TaxID=6412 RepID=T1FDS9_HELRO|nr:hypothetical protein HELRODRAFT_178827 [Helobdella robusta]ESN95912.1 hypothetical protein HELRODRAFT_178827 [Helobdella robusta]